jgi:hypothetical protein
LKEIDFKNISSRNFEEKALEIFRYQAENTKVYAQYLDYLKVDIKSVNSILNIPYLPISFFKTHKVFHQNKKERLSFSSSGTTGMVSSKHYLSDLSIYESSFRTGFELFYDNISDYCILALLPSYLEREGSSLIFMTQKLIE